MKTNIAITLLTFILTLSASAAHAKTVYVSDEMVIALRDGKGAEFKPVEYLRTGAPLEVLSEEGDYIKVRTAKGVEGWVQSRYISHEIPKAQVITSLQKEVADLKSASGDTAELVAERDRLDSENKRLMAENRKLEAESDRSEGRRNIYWFLTGAGVLFIGWLIGKASRQKRYY